MSEIRMEIFADNVGDLREQLRGLLPSAPEAEVRVDLALYSDAEILAEAARRQLLQAGDWQDDASAEG